MTFQNSFVSILLGCYTAACWHCCLCELCFGTFASIVLLSYRKVHIASRPETINGFLGLLILGVGLRLKQSTTETLDFPPTAFPLPCTSPPPPTPLPPLSLCPLWWLRKMCLAWLQAPKRTHYTLMKTKWNQQKIPLEEIGWNWDPNLFQMPQLNTWINVRDVCWQYGFMIDNIFVCMSVCMCVCETQLRAMLPEVCTTVSVNKVLLMGLKSDPH